MTFISYSSTRCITSSLNTCTINHMINLSYRVQKYPDFLKKPNPLGFLGVSLGFSDFFIWTSSWEDYFYRKNLQVHYLLSLEAVNTKKSFITTGMTNWNWIKLGVVFLNGFTPKTWWILGYYPGVWMLPLELWHCWLVDRKGCKVMH